MISKATKRFAYFVLASIGLLGATVMSASGAFAQTVLVSVTDTNVAVGASALAGNTTGVANTASGYEALRDSSTGSNNTASGYEALSSNDDGHNNTATGAGALRANTTGDKNTASGASALRTNTSGNQNTAIGWNVLYSNTFGSFNTASGYQAMHDNTSGGFNTASGFHSLFSNINGQNNTAIGAYALSFNESGSQNTAIGNGTLGANTSGDYNIALGYSSGSAYTTGDHNIAIGNSGVTGEAATIRIGDGDQTRAFVSGIRGVTTDVADGISVFIDSAGQLGTASSSRRYKRDIAEMASASDPLLALHPVTFRYKKPTADGRQPIRYGLIAEEVAELFPDLVVFNEDGQAETVKYHLLAVLLLNELKKEHSLNRQQENQLTALQGQVADLSELVLQIANAGNPAGNLVAMKASD